MRTCLECLHYHVAKDLEFTLVPDDQYREEIPKGKCFINLDLYWCDKPEDEDDDFSVLSWETPSQFQKEEWFPRLASVCSNFSPK